MVIRIFLFLASFLILMSCGTEESSETPLTCTSFNCPFKVSLHTLILNERLISHCLDPLENSYSCEKADPYVTVKVNDDLIYQTPVYSNTRVIEFDKVEEEPPFFELQIESDDLFEIQLFDHDELTPDTLVITCRDTLSQKILNNKRIFCRVSGLHHTVVFKIEALR